MTLLWFFLATAATPAHSAGFADPKPQPCKEFCEELRIVESVFAPLIPGAKPRAGSAFSVQRCKPIPVMKWAQFAFLGTSFQHKIAYEKGCDAKGDLNISRKAFPVELRLRNLKGVDKVQMREVLLEFAPVGTLVEIKITAKKGHDVWKRIQGECA